MSNVSQLHQQHDIQEQASLWISRLDRDLSDAETEQLGFWLEQSPKHHQTLLEMAAYWDDLTALNQLSTLFPLRASTKKGNRRYARFAIAASLVLVSLLSLNNLSLNNFWSSQGVHQANNQSFNTTVGEQANFMLPDGTKIHLNTDSNVTVAYTLGHRKLTLLKGEASFDVAKDKNRPFTVIVGSQSFTALGTVFNVQKNDDKAMELVVTEGRVLIAKAQQSVAQLSEMIDQDSAGSLDATIVISGEKAVIASDIEAPVIKVPLQQLQRDLAWQQGMLIFEGEPLDQALIEVSRYTATKFNIMEPHLAKLKVAGYFKAGDIDGLLASLNSNFNIVTNRNNDNVIELTSAR